MSQKNHRSGSERGVVRVRIVLDESSREFAKRLEKNSVNKATEQDARALQQLTDVRAVKSR